MEQGVFLAEATAYKIGMFKEQNNYIRAIFHCRIDTKKKLILKYVCLEEKNLTFALFIHMYLRQPKRRAILTSGSKMGRRTNPCRQGPG